MNGATSHQGQLEIVGSIEHRPTRCIDVILHNSAPSFSTMNEHVAQYYRCQERHTKFNLAGPLSQEKGFFRFGDEGLCYGQLARDTPSPTPNGELCNMIRHTSHKNGVTYLPFDITQVVDNLRLELYSKNSCHDESPFGSKLNEIYYFLRPLLPGGIRRPLQKARLSNWKTLKFPQWPVDRSVDLLFEQLLLASLRASGLEQIPFIWFWPDGASSCAIMTHDVETTVGRNFCATVMDLDDAYGIKASISIVPELRYEVTTEYLDSIWKRGFEVCVQDLNHDGLLFKDRQEYLVRVEKINAYGKQYGATGFRSAVLYRNQMWFDQLKFSYDMSVPNVAHLEPQRGGCCTVMPYFVGDILELPVTTTQDYALFNYLNEYSIDLWRRQIEIIMEQHGLVSIIVHPDYITKSREWNVYESLLKHLAQLRDEKKLWIPLSGEVDRWWRQRANMTLVEDDHGVQIAGAGSERARIAYASEMKGRLVYTLQPVPALDR
jgi:hypothetical protein